VEGGQGQKKIKRMQISAYRGGTGGSDAIHSRDVTVYYNI
jgi:hypothetical protein